MFKTLQCLKHKYYSFLSNKCSGGDQIFVNIFIE